MSNPLTEAKRANELLYALLAEFMEWHSGISPTADQVEKNVKGRQTAVAKPAEKSAPKKAKYTRPSS